MKKQIERKNFYSDLLQFNKIFTWRKLTNIHVSNVLVVNSQTLHLQTGIAA